MKLVFKVTIDGWDLTADGEDADGTVEHAIEVTLCYRGKDHLYEPGMAARELASKLCIGEISRTDRSFHSWDFTQPQTGPTLDCIQVPGPSLVQSLFYQSKWPAWADDDPLDDTHHNPIGENGTSLKYDFMVENECTYVAHKRDKEFVNIQLANFNVIRLCNIYQFADPSIAPYFKIVVRHMLNVTSDRPHGEGTYYLSAEDADRQPDLSDYKFLDVEVLFQVHTVVNVTDIASLFVKFSPVLFTSGLTLDHFQHMLQQFEKPEPDNAIMRFGRQPNGFFVAGNLCFKAGELYSHDQAGISIMPQYFADQDMAIQRVDYPKHVIIPQCQVRYVIAVDFHNAIMPRFFGNNTMQAHCTFAFGLMSLHASKFWEGQSGLGHG